MSASASPIPYTGSKSCIVKTILDVMPPHETYIEPCMGSAEVFFRKPPADREIINDYNGDLVNLFRVLQDNQNLDKVIGRLYLSLNAELLFRQNKELLTNTPNILDDLKETAEDMRAASWDEINSAVAFFENQVYSFSSTGQAFGIMRRDLTHSFSRLLAACNRLRNATILHRDYKDAISYGACENCFILLDPPYNGTEGYYPKADFDSNQHKRAIRTESTKLVYVCSQIASDFDYRALCGCIHATPSVWLPHYPDARMTQESRRTLYGSNSKVGKDYTQKVEEICELLKEGVQA